MPRQECTQKPSQSKKPSWPSHMVSHCHPPLGWLQLCRQELTRGHSVLFHGSQSWGDRWHRENVPFKHISVLCSVLRPFVWLTKLTIPGQPVGCSPRQRPAPLPGCSAGKHRCSPGATMWNTAASANAGRLTAALVESEKRARRRSTDLPSIAQFRLCGAVCMKGGSCRSAAGSWWRVWAVV